MSKARGTLLRRVANAVTAASDGDITLVTKPDHPLLFAGPDILAAGDGNLVAIFLPKSREIRNPKELSARLIAARLALPTHTKCLAVSAPELTIPEEICLDFDSVIDEKELNRFMRIAFSERRMPPHHVDALSESRRSNFIRYNALLHVSRVRKHAFTNKSSEEYIYKPMYQSSEREHYRSLYHYKNSVIGLKSTIIRKDLVNSVRSYCILSLTQNYILDSGVPYRARDEFDVAILTSMPNEGLDPEKPIRVGTFSGWMFIGAHSFEDVLRDMDRLTDFYHKTIDRMSRIG